MVVFPLHHRSEQTTTAALSLPFKNPFEIVYTEVSCWYIGELSVLMFPVQAGGVSVSLLGAASTVGKRRCLLLRWAN